MHAGPPSACFGWFQSATLLPVVVLALLQAQGGGFNMETQRESEGASVSF